MKKLLSFLLMLTVSLGSWAYSGDFEGVSFQDIGSDTQFIEMTTAGSLSTWAQNETELGYMGQTSRTKLVITGPMSASDFTALSGSAWDSFTTVDLSKVTVTDPTYISNMTLANAQTIILPNGLTKEQIASLKNEASGVVAGLVGTSETAYVDHYYYTLLPGETEQEYTGTVSGSEGNYYFHETKTYQRPLTIQDGYPTFTWIDLLGDTQNLTEEQATNANGSWIPENVDVPLLKNISYSYSYTYNGQTYSYTITGDNLSYINTVPDNSEDTETTVNTTFSTWTGVTNITIPEGATITISPAYKFHHLTETWEYWLDYPTANNVSYDEANNRYIGTLVNGGTVQDQWGNTVNYGTATFPISSNYKYDYTDIRGNDLTYPAEGTLSAADEDGFVDWLFDEDVALRKVQIPYNNLTEVEGMVAYVNTAGSLSDVASVFYDSDLASAYRSSENITVLGNISNADLTELGESNFASVNFLDMSGAVLTGDVTTLSSKGTAAIVLPNIQDGDEVRIVSTAEMGTLQQRKMPNDDNNYNFKCLAYLDDAAYQSSGNDHKVCVYTTQCSSLTNLSSFINTNSSLVFLPLYKTDGTLDNYMLQYNNEIANLLTYVKDLPALNIDFGMVYAGVSTDFSQLNPATHYITIPVTSTDYDFTDEVNPYNAQTGEKYIYGDNIYVVATYKNPEGIYAKSCSYAGKPFTATEPTNITYVRQAGTLSGASGTVSQEMMTATRQIFVGTLDDSDVSAMAMMHATTFDFLDATISAENMKAFHNGYVHYLILPDNEESAIAVTSEDVCNYRDMNNNTSSKCPELLCVGAYNTTTNTLTTWSSAPGNVYAVTSLIRPQNTGRGTGLNCATLNNVVMSGELNLADISSGSANGINNGLEGATIKNADLRNAYFPTQTDMTFAPGYSVVEGNPCGASWGSIEHILLPTDTRQTLIPNYCLSGAGVLTEICIPSNYETIGIDAFFGTDLTHVYTTAYPGDENNFIVDTDGDGIADVYDHGDHTITLSSNLQEIRRGAFCTKIGNANKGFSDVYVLRAEAPKCEGNAFHSVSYMGNNTFAGSTVHPISRGSYEVNHGYLAVLHYPSSVTEEQEAKFTDVTRDYTLTDEMGMYNNKGEIISWPRQTEFLRAYNQAVSGVTWNGWPTTRPFSSIEDAGRGDYNEIIYDGTSNGFQNGTIGGTSMYYGQDSSAGTIGLPDPTGDDNDYPGTYNPQYAYDWANYMGWHQFVLTNGNSTQQKKTVATEYVNGGWYTLCLPYDMTAAEVIEAMGAPAGSTFDNTKRYNYESTLGVFPRVYSLRTVKRDYPTINLTFSLELMAQTAQGKTLSFDNDNGTIDYVTPDEMYKKKGEVVYLRGGYPYMVRPLVPANNPNVIGDNLGNYILKNMQFDENDLGNKAEVKTGQFIAMPIISQKILALDREGHPIKFSSTDGDELDTDYYYYFQGTYADQDMPEAYYLSGGSWKRQMPGAEAKTWDGFTAIIGGKADKETGSVYKTDNPNPASFTGITTYYVSLTSKNDDFTKVGDNRVKYQFLFEGEEGFDEAVAIDKIDGKDINAVTKGNVYNMAGQLVGSSLDGLAKGLYIQNGKKVMVK